MSHEKWDDDKIEQLLSNAPKIHDHRSKDDVLQRLKDEGVDELLLNKKTKTKKFYWVPILISVAALCLLAIVIPSMTGQQMESSNSGEESKTIESTEKLEDSAEEFSESSDVQRSSLNVFSTEAVDLKTAVYPEDIEGKTVFKLGLSSDAADSIPVTVLIPNEKIEEDFDNTKPTGVQLYNQYAPLFNEEAIGFVDYHPYVGEITEQNNQVVHTLPNSQSYDIASAAYSLYNASLVDTFSYYYDEIAFFNEEGAPFEFSQVGEPSTPLEMKNEQTQYNYFEYTQPDGSQYLAPNFRATFATVEEAINAMKDETNDVYQSVILPNIDYEVRVEGDIATVNFTQQLDLMAFDQVQAMQMIEGILLTASSFNMQVQFENVLQTEWQGFDLTNPLPMPVGANEIDYALVLQ
ncbi:GerMN domain-containing protein [Lysinibacillus telephonicus]|uniref:Uncharacterized protein n=1 Tax=Lysinibacillus telephonicus TaxID=1714840 RepID=A0A3S0HXR6_9BACI|nr:GerMN domain-containing protein [Lysinibacillus telephonicus]RTQ90060.1 hypothetical protein EKG35_15420 [Lysinibacillus telephonicus]